MHWHLNQKTMKFSKAIFFFLLCCEILSAQEKAPEKFSKIRFVYNERSNYIVCKEGVYADTLLLRFDFPDMRFEKAADSIYPGYYGFIAFKDFSEADREKLKHNLYHAAQKISGVYNLKTNSSQFTITRDDAEMRKIFKDLLDEGYSRFAFTASFDYSKQTMHLDFETKTYDFKFIKKAAVVNFSDDSKLKGKYIENGRNGEFTNLVYFDESLTDKIVPQQLFSNSDFGVRKLVTIWSTIELESVIYE
jgi:hypothetical protein